MRTWNAKKKNTQLLGCIGRKGFGGATPLRKGTSLRKENEYRRILCNVPNNSCGKGQWGSYTLSLTKKRRKSNWKETDWETNKCRTYH